jgi:hypothetical protein
VKWAAILLMGLCTIIAIAVVHSDNRLACAMGDTLCDRHCLVVIADRGLQPTVYWRDLGQTRTPAASNSERNGNYAA